MLDDISVGKFGEMKYVILFLMSWLHVATTVGQLLLLRYPKKRMKDKKTVKAGGKLNIRW